MGVSEDALAAAGRRWLPAARGRWPFSLGGTLLFAACVPIFLYLLLPTLVVVPMAFTPKPLLEFPPSGVSLRPFRDLFHDGAWISAGVVSLKAASLAVVIASVVGTMAALALHAVRFPGQGLLQSIILVPIVAPLIVLALADYEFLLKFHLTGTWTGIGLSHSVLAAPYVFITVQASLAGLDPALVRSARSLGAGSLSVFRHVYIPALRPGLAAGALLAFIASFDETVIALFQQGPQATTLPVKMFTDIQYELSPKIAAVAALLVGVATLVFLVQTAALVGRRSRAHGGWPTR
ncbi:MAG TPA: ABC transporter permease [bacterium]|nr:ABC transporter permease [bacterium]